MEFLSNALTRMFALIRMKTEIETIIIWADYLTKTGLTNEAIMFACKSAIEDPAVDPYRFTVAKLIEYVQPKLTNKELAQIAWGKVIAHIRARGSYGSLPLEIGEATIAAVKSCGGLAAIGDTKETDLGFVQHRFVEAYNAIAKSHPENLCIGSANLPKQLQIEIDKAMEAISAN